MTTSLRPLFRKVFREPLVHFILIGGLIYLAYALTLPDKVEPDQREVRVTANEIQWLEDSWQKRWNRAPTSKELQGLIKAYVRETVLYREALAMGLDKDDTIIRRRLAQKLEFLSQDLLQPPDPSERELRTFFDEHSEQFRGPELLTLTHVFFDPDKRGDKTLKDAVAAKTGLPHDGNLSGIENVPGDRFMLQSYYPERSNAELSKLFGSGFADSVFKLEPKQWHGPVLSAYGAHLVFIHDLQVSPAPKFASLKEKVRSAWEKQRRSELNRKFIERLLARYTVTIEEVSPGDRVDATSARIQ